MRKRGVLPKGKTSTRWTQDLAYAVGLIATDGCLSSNGRSIILVSKDRDQLKNFLACIRRKDISIGVHVSGSGKRACRVQISDVEFYGFLLGIGLTQRKSKTLGALVIPGRYFFDFLRGVFDGDGSTYAYMDRRWRGSYLLYTQFASASPAFLGWLRGEVRDRLGISGHMTRTIGYSTRQLKYGTRESCTLLPAMYSRKGRICLSRKRLKIERSLRILGKRL